MKNNYAEIYDEEYFEEYECGQPVEKGIPYGSAAIRIFLSRLAQAIVENMQFVTAIDVGCATGVMVTELRKYNKAAYGIDVSRYALEKSGCQHCYEISILDTESIFKTFCSRFFDVAICIEVLEHIFPEDIDCAIDNLCGLSDVIIFSSCPPTLNKLIEDSERFPSDLIHPSVHDGNFWLTKFYERGYVIDSDLTVKLRDELPWIYVLRK